VASAIVIINRDSGTAGSLVKDGDCPGLVRRFAQRDWAADVRIADATTLAATLRAAVRENPEALVVGGGDGTVLAAVAALGDSRVPLGILPLGTFNTLSRDLGLPQNWQAAIGALADAGVRRIDVARVNGRPFLSLCVLGFFASAARDGLGGRPWWMKATRTLWHTFQSYLDYPEMDLHLETGGHTHDERTRFVGIANNPFQDDAGLIVPQRETLDAGELAVYVAAHSTRWGIMRAGMAFLAGRLSRDPDLTIHSAQSARIDVAGRKRLHLLLDGEVIRESLPLRFSIHPRQLSVLAPQTPGSPESSP